MIDDVSSALAKDSRFSAWQVTEVRGRSTQRYQVFGDVESRRQVESRACDVRVHVLHPDGTLGESSFTVVDLDTPLEPSLDAAFARARLVKNKAWTLPGPGEGGATVVRAVDPRMVEVPEEAADDVGGQIVSAVRAAGGVELSASEVFCDYRRVHLRSSRGLDVTREETSAYAEYVLLAKSAGADELEVYQSRRARDLKDLAIAEQVEDDVVAARAGATAILPETGIVDVVLGGAGTEEIFDAFVAHATGAAKFDNWSRLVEGEPVVALASGYDKLTLSSDATIPGGLGTFSFDDVGLPGRRLDVIVDGVFKRRACDQRYACWLGAQPTGTWGNTVVAPGSVDEAELLRPGARPLYQLLRFSQLSPHATTGAFSGEIRFGWKIVDGKKTPVRGGSISGVAFDAFARARFSRETAVRGRTHGPRAVRLDAIQITGG
jgi:predicted Zn-dependent protease